MEPIFSNSCTYTKENLVEMNKTMLPFGYKAYCISFIFIFIIIAAAAFNGGQTGIGITFSVCCILIVLIFVNKARSSANKVYNYYNKTYGTEVETKTFFYDSIIVGKNLQTDISVQTSYDDVTSVMESKSMYILKLHKNIALTVDKNGFIGDSAEGFRDFIKDKCANAKIKI